MEEKGYDRNPGKPLRLFSGALLYSVLIGCNTSDDKPVFACGEEVSLETQIMPIINSDCAIPLCHLDGSHPILDSKAAVITHALGIRAQVENFQMPPGGQEPLSAAEIERITCWVEDGAENN